MKNENSISKAMLYLVSIVYRTVKGRW